MQSGDLVIEEKPQEKPKGMFGRIKGIFKNNRTDSINQEKEPSQQDSSSDIDDNKVDDMNIKYERPVKSGGGMNEAFVLIYKICAFLSVLLFVGITIISIYDVISFNINEVSQTTQMFIDPKLMINETTDVESLKYINNNVQEEPYNIYTQQALVSTIYIVIGCAIAVLGLQFAIFLGMKIYATIKHIEFEETVKLPFQFLAVIIVSLLGAIVVSNIYRYQFINKTQPSLRALRSKLRDVKTYIYRNLTNDSAFLAALKANNDDTVIEIMNKSLMNKSALMKMMFTYNLYYFFMSNIPEMDASTDSINRLFSSQGMRTQKVDPAMMFYYKKAESVANLYYSLKPKLTFTLDGDISFANDLNVTMTELNKKLMNIQSISEGKSAVSSYMWRILWTSLGVTFVLIMILLFIYVKDFFPRMLEFFKSMFRK